LTFITVTARPIRFYYGFTWWAVAISQQVLKVTGNSKQVYLTGVEIAYPFGAQAAPLK